MKVLHAPAWYPPYSIGGTEIYVAGLVAELRARGVDCSIAVPRHPNMPSRYLHDGTEVITYPISEQPSRRELRGVDPPKGLEEFKALLADFDIYHQHALARGCGVDHFSAARAAGLRTVLTVHTPNATCLRGTMLLRGKTPCDGRIDQNQCAACWAEERGAPPSIATATALVPHLLAAAAASLSTSGLPQLAQKALTLMSANELVAAKARDFAVLAAAADKVVAVCAWLKRALADNGLDATKLVLSRQGIETSLAAQLGALALNKEHRAGPIVFGLIGRWQSTKGIDLAIRAMRCMPVALGGRLEIHATSQGKEGAAYRDQCLALAKGDERIVVHDAFERSELPSILSRLDVLLVPSRWLETGPLVALEAMAAGIWVIGSAIGGLAELVEDGRTGTLAPVNDEAAWTQAMSDYIGNPRRPEKRVMRTMSDVAAEMVKLYAELRSPTAERASLGLSAST